MEFIVLSYVGGMSGDFIATEISKNPNFAVSTEQNITDQNMYLTDNKLSIINFDPKNWPRLQPWPIDENKLRILSDAYQGKRIVLPTHWFDKNLNHANLPAVGVRISSVHPVVVRFSYCMAWAKSQVYALTVWEDRRKEIEMLIANNHTYSSGLSRLLEPDQYLNWKYVSYVSFTDTLVNNKPNLYNYMKYWYSRYELQQDTFKKLLPTLPDWFELDITDIVLNNTGFEPIEEKLTIKLDRQSFKSYFNKNLQLLNKQIGMTLKDLERDDWLDHLHDYCYSISQKLGYIDY